MILWFSLAAVVTASMFTGAAGYISLVEHPARLPLEDGPLLEQWKPSYARALPLQSGLALIGGLLGIAAGYVSGSWIWIAGGVALLANWPFTILAIKPTNNRLNAIPTSEAGSESRALIIKWGKLHAVRSMLGAVATALFVMGMAAVH